MHRRLGREVDSTAKSRLVVLVSSYENPFESRFKLFSSWHTQLRSLGWRLRAIPCSRPFTVRASYCTNLKDQLSPSKIPSKAAYQRWLSPNRKFLITPSKTARPLLPPLVRLMLVTIVATCLVPDTLVNTMIGSQCSTSQLSSKTIQFMAYCSNPLTRAGIL